MSAGKRIDVPCPTCAAPLLSDGTHAWCSNIGGKGQRACSFGIRQPVLLASLPVPADGTDPPLPPPPLSGDPPTPIGPHKDLPDDPFERPIS